LLTLCNQTGGLDAYALHCAQPELAGAVQQMLDPAGMSSAEALATGKPVVARDTDVNRYPNPAFRQSWRWE
jgi:hypothetical protein